MVINKTSILGSALGVALLSAAAVNSAAADTYPSKPIKVIIATGAGGSHDLHSRAVASVIPAYLGQAFIIQMKSGGGGKIGMNVLKKAKPDGYTIGLVTGSHFAIAAHGKDMGFDTLKDFIPFYQVNYAPTMVVVKASSPWKTLKEFAAAAKAAPGKLTMSSSGQAGASHMMLLQINRGLGIKVKHVPFRGGGKAFNAMWGGHVDMAMATPTTGGALSKIKAGKARALAMATPTRSKLLPNVPTLHELGIDYEYLSWRVFAAPAGTPKAKLDVLVKALRKTSKDKTFKRLLKRFGEQNIPLDGPELVKKYRDTYNFYGKLFEANGLKYKKKM
jgi:tripartite-type tricarboxylate transporter receptor subunit TctC